VGTRDVQHGCSGSVVVGTCDARITDVAMLGEVRG
jgi:hypothetical protein